MLADRATAGARHRAVCGRHAATAPPRLGRPRSASSRSRSSSTSTITSPRLHCRATPTFLQKQDREQLERDAARARQGSRRQAARSPPDTTPAARRSPDYGVAPAIHADGALVQLAAADAAAAARQGRADRLLDVLVHQLPAHAPAPQGVGRGLPQARARDHRRAHARVRVRARHVERRSAAVKRLGITYPVVQDNDFGTWDNYSNQYWPAEYLIDRTGHIRHTHFGEGEYDETESLIRTLLGVHGADRAQGREHDADRARTRRRPISATSGSRATSARGSSRSEHATTPSRSRSRRTRLATPASGASRASRSSPARTRGCGCTSRRTTSTSCSAAGARARADRRQADRDGQGRRATGSTRCAPPKSTIDGLLELRFSPGVQAYAFTFG